MCAPETTIRTAIQRGFFQQVRFLVQFGHNVNERDGERRTPMMLCALIEEEIWGVGLARLFIEKGANMGLRDRRGLTCLHYACIYERHELVRVLLSVADFDINQTDKLGNTPLHYAVTHGQVGTTRCLLDTLSKYGQTADVPNKRGITPLMAAWRGGWPECARAVRTAIGDALDPDARDHVEERTVADWEAEYWAGQAGAAQRDAENRRPPTASKRGPRTRPVSAAITRSIRPHSAFSTDSRTRRSPSDDKPLLRRTKENNNCKKVEVVDGLVDKNAMSVRLIHSASMSDLRNKPEFVFNVSPTECFMPESRFQGQHASQPSLGSQHGGPSTHSAGPNTPTNSWKQDVRRFYDEFGFQFSGSYRKSAKPPEPGQGGGAAGDGRYSPNPSEFNPDQSVSGLSISSTARKFALRKSSAKSTSSEDDKRNSKRKNSAIGGRQNRRGSILMGSPQSLLKAQQTNMDTSSNESINTGHKPTKKRNTNSPDAKDDSSDTSSNDKRSERGGGRTGSGRSRKGLDSTTPSAPEPAHGRPNKGAGHTMVPVVREPTIKE